MTTGSAASGAPAPVLRLLSAEVHGDQIRLRGELSEPTAVQLVLRERGSGAEIRVDPAAEGAEAGFAAALDARALPTDREGTTWDLRVEPVGTVAAAGPSGYESLLDTAKIPSVVLRRDGGLHRVRLRGAPSGELTLTVETMPPHAEVQDVTVEDDALVLVAVLDRVAVPDPAATVSLVASSRDRKAQVQVPAVLDGRTVRGRLPFDALAADAPGTEYWDLSVRSEAFGTLRVGGHLDDVPDKKNAIAYPARQVPSPGGGRSLRPYFTLHNNLSIRSKPLRPDRAPARGSGRAGRRQTASKAVQRLAHRMVRTAAEGLARTLIHRLPSRRPIQPVRNGRPLVSIFIIHGYGMGGTVRTVFNQAAYLSRDFEVEVVSQIRGRKEPFFPVPPGVGLTALDDRTEGAAPGWPLRLVHDRLARLPSLLIHEDDGSFARSTLWSDIQLVRRLRAQQGGILMATRPSLNLLIAQLAAPGVITVGQEHMNFHQKRPALARDLHRWYRRLDALTVLTCGDLEDYSRVLAGSGTRVVRIPNAASPLTGGPADPTSRIVVAAGRLTNQKGFDRLIPAFEQVVREHPDWTLRIFGSGPHRARLQRMIRDRGLSSHVLLMGRTDRMGEELAKASVYVMSSRFEGFPMVLIEAMSKGLAVVSYDCPRGPSDLITPGEDGLLVPEGDIDGLAQALLQVVGDEECRRRFSGAALRTAERYAPESVGRQWDELLSGLLADRAPSWWRPELRSAPSATPGAQGTSG